jgi:hypothetical protein|tara:strand:+ start:87 stop:299 length:213 start_codon:yes stop_codon:yes gene_type:complete
MYKYGLRGKTVPCSTAIKHSWQNKDFQDLSLWNSFDIAIACLMYPKRPSDLLPEPTNKREFWGATPKDAG